MARDLSLRAFLGDLGARLAAAGVVLAIFLGLGYLNRIDTLGLSAVLGTPLGFFGVAFGLVAVASLLWIGFQQSRS